MVAQMFQNVRSKAELLTKPRVCLPRETDIHIHTKISVTYTEKNLITAAMGSKWQNHYIRVFHYKLKELYVF